MGDRLLFIPGLGADERVFERLPPFPGLISCYIRWIPPRGRESLESYCMRLIDDDDISITDRLIGLSFGGVVAQKIADLLGIKGVILISSLRDQKDLRLFFQLGLKLKLYKVLPAVKLPVIADWIAFYLNSSWRTESKLLLREMLKTTDMGLFRWSIEKIAEITPIKSALTTYSLIGSKDRVVKPWKGEYFQLIAGGMMVYDKSDEVAAVLKKMLEALPANASIPG